jgi:hypothetical protein
MDYRVMGYQFLIAPCEAAQDRNTAWPQPFPVTDSLRQALKERDELDKWQRGEWLPPDTRSPSISYSLDDLVGELSIGELFALIDFRVEDAFAEREAPPPSSLTSAQKRKPEKPYKLLQGVRDAADHVACQNDTATMEKFLKRFPQDQRAVLEAYIAQKAAAP